MRSATYWRYGPAGGQVAEFHYRAFWGYVVPIGSFTAAQSWFIAIAGTLASLAFGLFVWWVFRRASSSTLRYFGLRAFRFQVYFSLIYYPLFTLLGFDGDWRTIYDFSATPLLSLADGRHSRRIPVSYSGAETGRDGLKRQVTRASLNKNNLNDWPWPQPPHHKMHSCKFRLLMACGAAAPSTKRRPTREVPGPEQ